MLIDGVHYCNSCGKVLGAWGQQHEDLARCAECEERAMSWAARESMPIKEKVEADERLTRLENACIAISKL